MTSLEFDTICGDCDGRGYRTSYMAIGWGGLHTPYECGACRGRGYVAQTVTWDILGRLPLGVIPRVAAAETSKDALSPEEPR